MQMSRRLTLLGAFATSFLPWRAKAATDKLAAVDPELRTAARLVMAALPEPKPGEDLIRFLRTSSAVSLRPKPSETPAISPIRFPGEPGQPDVRAFLVGRPDETKKRGAILYLHGGGFIAGSAESDLADCQELARDHDCLVLAPEYRLAPETAFPGARADNYAALAFLHQHAEKFGVDPARIIVVGGSAGGGHAAQLSLLARDRGRYPIAAQVLIYPMLDDRTGVTVDPGPAFGQILWTRALNHAGWAAYLGQEPGGPTAPEGAAPARTQDLSGLPPTFIGTGGLDLFAPEDIAFSERLLNAGVPTELLVVPGAFHGFNLIARQAGVSKRFNAAWNDFIARRLASAT